MLGREGLGRGGLGREVNRRRVVRIVRRVPVSDRVPYLRISVLTGFPRILEGIAADGMVRLAVESGRLELNVVDLRLFADDPHRSIDDYPYGGGPGMILKVEPVVRALASLPPPLAPESSPERGSERGPKREVILLSPQGRTLDQPQVREMLEARDLVLLFGRYKGLDERVRAFVTREVSLGDFILSGGEPAAVVLIDALARLIPGVMGDIESAESDSFERGLLDCGYFTRPEEYRGMRVPEVLLCGHHGRVEEERRRDALRRTWRRRPELLETAVRAGEVTRNEIDWLLAQGWTAPSDWQPPPREKRRRRKKNAAEALETRPEFAEGSGAGDPSSERDEPAV